MFAYDSNNKLRYILVHGKNKIPSILGNTGPDDPPNYDDVTNMDKCPDYDEAIAQGSIFVISSSVPM